MIIKKENKKLNYIERFYRKSNQQQDQQLPEHLENFELDNIDKLGEIGGDVEMESAEE